MVPLLVASIGGCGLTEPDDCDLCTTSAIVYGVVRDDSGAPVADATVRVEAFFADSLSGRTTSQVGGTNIVMRTDAAGAYRDRPFPGVAPFRAGLIVRVTPPRRESRQSSLAGGA